MISIDSLSSEWIDRIAREHKYGDKPLLEKAIRALYLVETLVRKGCPLTFKGGSCLLLLLKDSLHRLSIDVDIICPPCTDINEYLGELSDYGFTRVIPAGKATSHGNLPVSHSKVYFEVEYKTNSSEGYVKLDVLYEDNPYSNVIKLPITHKILKTEGEPVLVSIPSMEDMLGDKLTAFGPNSIGIPYFKGDRDCSLEIIKQLFDNGRLFENVNDFEAVTKSFNKISEIELGYRGLGGQISEYYADVRNTALTICTRGRLGTANFPMLQQGIMKLKSFMYQRSYMIQDAVADAARIAYLATCMEKRNYAVEKISDASLSRGNLVIKPTLPQTLSRLKSSSPEAFFYWSKTSELLEY